MVGFSFPKCDAYIFYVEFSNYWIYKLFYVSFKSLYWPPTFLYNYRVISTLDNVLVPGISKTISKSIQVVYNLVYSGLCLASYHIYLSSKAMCAVVKLSKLYARGVYFKKPALQPNAYVTLDKSHLQTQFSHTKLG